MLWAENHSYLKAASSLHDPLLYLDLFHWQNKLRNHSTFVYPWGPTMRSYSLLARISKMPVQNSNFKISACPDLATQLLQILIPATINRLVCQKGQFTLQLCPRIWFVRTWLLLPKSQNWKIFIEIFDCPNRRFLENYLSKRQVLAKSLGPTNIIISQSGI